MSKTFTITKEDWKEFMRALMDNYEVIAPVKKDDIHIFERVENFEDMDLNFINTTFPPKKYFSPHPENILDYAGEKIKIRSHDKNKKVIFGIRPCDVNVISNYDKVFLDDEFPDDYYAKKRKNTLILALNCSKPGENCFCTSLGTDKLSQGNFDLLFTEEETKEDGNYFVELGSKRGAELINKNKKLFKKTNKEPAKIELKCKKKITEENLNKLNDHEKFHSKIWENYAERCLSCCACTMTCPTCTCFGLRDLINMDLISGSRVREWHSCQLKVFTRVAGEYFFRDERYKRLRHRIYHQLNYFKKRHGTYLCVGCGRCISNCPTKIDMLEIMKEL